MIELEKWGTTETELFYNAGYKKGFEDAMHKCLLLVSNIENGNSRCVKRSIEGVKNILNKNLGRNNKCIG